MKDFLNTLIQSKHTSLAGGLVLLCTLGEIWMPQYTEQFHKTREFAMSYGLILAGDAIRRGVKNGQTEFLNKKDAPQEPPKQGS